MNPVKSRRTELALYAAGLIFSVLAAPGVCQAYVGPGLGLGAIGSFFALLGAMLFGVLGFIWYPIKRLIRRFRPKSSDDAE
jgi:hypothetical protein